jgi:hypothetical protein
MPSLIEFASVIFSPCVTVHLDNIITDGNLIRGHVSPDRRPKKYHRADSLHFLRVKGGVELFHVRKDKEKSDRAYGGRLHMFVSEMTLP